MNFTNLSFLLAFVPISVVGYYLVSFFGNKSIKEIYLICVSLIFYKCAGSVSFLSLIMYLILVYILGVLVNNNNKNKNAFIFSVSIILVILLYFKYFGFFISQIDELILFEFRFDNILAPLGISFITFESISYLVDIYTKKAKPGNILDVFLFILYFPKVISGPIVLWRDFERQLDLNVKPSVDSIDYSVCRIIVGLSKKVLIADVLGITVVNVWSNLNIGIDQPTAWLCALAYMMQIYFDFSGYSDMAIGISCLFGIRIKENFNKPYTSTSISEFWRRWHISLGSWFREYVYFPLGGSREGNVYFNLFIVFLLTGIWHGAAYNFILWGILQGFVVMFERIINKTYFYANIPLFIKRIVTFVTIYFSWILFIAPSMSELIDYIRIMFLGIDNSIINYSWEWYFDKRAMFVMIIGFVLSIFPNSTVNNGIVNEITKRFLLLILLLLSIVFIVNLNYSPFLYFQF